ncbi:hypothetical protein [Actinoplanes sp. DH11]|uniref:hypothetical protein n=1 Tax=Actinoplanes sp. DH11 TaxID=2857011 RepID=UPI001E5AD9EB|nr:hypothetical protein [Actinoplanes sp. DH11]
MTNQEADLLVASHGPPVTPGPTATPSITSPPAAPATPQLVASLCGVGTCPTVYSTDRDTVLVQGYPATADGVPVPAGELLVEIPKEVLLEAARRLQEQSS